jgi:site-specific recombinase XerD
MGHMELADYLDKFVEFLRSAKKATATTIAYRKDIDQLLEYLKKTGRAKIEDVTAEDLNNFLALLHTQNYTPKSISRKINSIKTFYRFLILHKYTNNNVAATVAHPKFETKAPRILTRMEYRALRDACREDVRIAAVVELLLQTGMRIGELAALTTSSPSENFIKIPPIEGHASREVPLNKAAKVALDHYLAVRPKVASDALFITKTGRPLLIRNIRTAIDRYFKIAGISGAKVNDLRHTFIAHHLAAGTSPILVSKLVGHKRISTTEKYLEFIKDLPAEKVKLEEL